MKKLIFIVFPFLFSAQTDQYKAILLSKQIGKKVDSYRNGYGTFHIYKLEAGIVDSLGIITYTAPKNGYISNIKENRFILYVEGKNYSRKSALIDKNGTQLIPLDDHSFDSYWNNYNYLIVSKNKKQSLYDYNGKSYLLDKDEIKFADKDRVFVKENGSWFLYDNQGNKLSEHQFKDNEYFENKKLKTFDGKTSFIFDEKGTILHEFKGINIKSIASYPYLITENLSTKKYGLIDTKGNVLVDEIYDNYYSAPFPFNNNAITFEKEKNKYVYSISEQKIILTEKNYFDNLFKNYFIVFDDKTYKKGIQDNTRKLIFPTEYDIIQEVKIADQPFVYMEKDKKRVLLDENFQSVFSDDYKLIAFFPNDIFLEKENAYFRASFPEKDLKKLDEIQKIKEEPLYFFNPIYPYSLPPIVQNSDGLYGMLNQNGTMIIPFLYDEIIRFTNYENQLVVRKGKKFGVINYENEPLTEIKFDRYLWKKEVVELKKENKSEFLNFTHIDYKKLEEK